MRHEADPVVWGGSCKTVKAMADKDTNLLETSTKRPQLPARGKNRPRLQDQNNSFRCSYAICWGTIVSVVLFHIIYGTYHAKFILFGNMGVDHCRSYVGMTQ